MSTWKKSRVFIKFINTSRPPKSSYLMFCLLLVTTASAHITRFSFPAVQLTSTALEAHYYHIIYESWPCGMYLKHEYQWSSAAALLPRPQAPRHARTYACLLAEAQVYRLAFTFTEFSRIRQRR